MDLPKDHKASNHHHEDHEVVIASPSHKSIANDHDHHEGQINGLSSAGQLTLHVVGHESSFIVDQGKQDT